jgi:hypothetical protein
MLNKGRSGAIANAVVPPMAESVKKPGSVMSFVQQYRLKMLIPELLVVFGVYYMSPDSPKINVYLFLGQLSIFAQPVYFIPSGLLLLLTAFMLHGIYPLDNYHEGKIPTLPKAAVLMILLAFAFLPLLVAFQMAGYFITEATEYLGRNPLWERMESVGDLLFYAGPMFFLAFQWWLFIPVLFLSEAVDGIHKIAHHETSSVKVAVVFYFLWPVSMPFFFDPVEIMAMAALSIPAFAFYSYVRPYYAYVTAVHTLTFALLVVVTMVLGQWMPFVNMWFPGFIPPHIPPRIWPPIL